MIKDSAYPPITITKRGGGAPQADPLSTSELELTERLNQELLYHFFFQFRVNEEGFSIMDCRKTPACQINKAPYPNLTKAMEVMGKLICQEYKERNELWLRVNRPKRF